MSVALVTRTTSRVEHLAAWAYDNAPDAWYAGRFVPICAQERKHGRWTVVDTIGYTPDPVRRKPLCSRCIRRLGELHALAESTIEAADEPLPDPEEETDAR